MFKKRPQKIRMEDDAMKKAGLVLLLLAFLLGMVACKLSLSVGQEGAPDSEATVMPSPTATPTPLPSPSEASTSPDNSGAISSDTVDLQFSDLADLEFWFGSGSGAWCTTVTIQPDGTFSGYYSDSNMGDTGDDYPYGTMYECSFSGQFSSPQKIGDFEYLMKCESLTIEGNVGEEKIIDGVMIITAEPYGFDNAGDFYLYLPGKKLNELPDEFLGWVHIDPETIDAESVDVLEFYGLYNVGGEQGFST